MVAGGRRRQLLSRISVYAMGEVGARALSLLLVPLYARALSPGDFGAYLVLLGLIQLASLGLGLGQPSAVTILYYDPDISDTRGALGAVFGVTLAGGVLVVMGWTVVEALGLGRASVSVSYFPYGLIALGVGALQGGVIQVGLAFLRAAGDARRYILVSLGLLAGRLFGAVVFVGVLRWELRGAMVAELAAAVGVVLLVSWLTRPRASRRADMLVTARRALRLGLPLIPHALSMWALIFLDRLILERVMSLDRVAAFAAGAQLGGVVVVLAGATNNGILPLFGAARRGSDRDCRRAVRAFSGLVALVLVAATLGVLWAPVLVPVVLGPGYEGAVRVTVIIGAAGAFMALYYGPMNALTVALVRPSRVALATGTAAGVLIILNLLAAPRFGLVGVALVRVVGYAVLSGLIFAMLPARGTPWRRMLARGAWVTWPIWLVLVGVIAWNGAGAVTRSIGAIGLATVGVLVAGTMAIRPAWTAGAAHLPADPFGDQ